jgi:hypothetical protein
MPTQPRPVRYRCELFASIEADELQSRARVLEMSESGAFIEEAEGFDDRQVGDEATMTLALPGGEPWSGRFRISRLGTGRRELKDPRVEHVTVSARGYGVEFVEVDDDELERLRDFLELLELR